MLVIRKAASRDKKEILNIIKEQDLAYPGQKLDCFWVAEQAGQIRGIVCLEDFLDFRFLSALGVLAEFQRQGVAAGLLNFILNRTTKDVYLYTLIPEFFGKFGFEVVKQTAHFPSKDNYECEACFPDKCQTMVLHKKTFVVRY